MQYDEYGNEKNEIWFMLDDIEKGNLSFQETRETLYSMGMQHEKNNEKLERIIQNKIVSFMDENKIDVQYYEYIYKDFFNTPVAFDDFYNTRIEKTI